MNGRSVLALALLSLLAGCACGGGGEDPTPAAPAPAAPEGTLPELAHLDVTLYFPDDTGQLLLPETRSIVKTAEPGTLAKQVLGELAAGPQGSGGSRALPEGTVLRQVYLTPEGVAYADFGPELRAGLSGGSAAELMAVYAVVQSLTANVPGVAKVAILVDGQPVESLNGHLDLTRPLRPRPDLVKGTPPAAPVP
jgi:germination protein M